MTNPFALATLADLATRPSQPRQSGMIFGTNWKPGQPARRLDSRHVTCQGLAWGREPAGAAAVKIGQWLQVAAAASAFVSTFISFRSALDQPFTIAADLTDGFDRWWNRTAVSVRLAAGFAGLAAGLTILSLAFSSGS
jgi:hypothetical protein